MSEGCHNDENIEFYGRLKEIIELRYNSDTSESRTVVLFRCDWFDTHGKKVRMKDDEFFKSINHGSYWYKDDPFILATQATKVFYLEDTKYRENWRIVQKFTHRHLWNVDENDNEEIPNGLGLSYQDETCAGFHVRGTEGNLDDEILDNEDCHQVEASLVDEILKQREDEVQEVETSDDEDETRWQYVSDNESPMKLVEDDDSSDGE